MTSSDPKLTRLSIKMPFGYAADKTTISDNSTALLSYENGFGAPYASPTASGGKFVTRADMNGFGDMATRNQFIYQAGGLNTFSQNFARIIGGYPYGAVLDYMVGTTLYKVMSLKDNNMVDFTGALPTQTGIIQGGVDGVNWEYVNMDKPLKEMADLGPIGSIIPPGCSTILRAFIAPKNGTLYFDGTYDQNPSGTGGVEWLGAGLFAKAWSDGAGSPLPEEGFNGWTPVYGFAFWRYYTSDTVTAPINPSAFEVTRGTKYLIASASGVGGGVSVDNIAPAVVTNLDMHAYII